LYLCCLLAGTVGGLSIPEKQRGISNQDIERKMMELGLSDLVQYKEGRSNILLERSALQDKENLRKQFRDRQISLLQNDLLIFE
jgi:hypothetical protein